MQNKQETQFIPIDPREFAHRKERAVSVPVEQTLWTGVIVFVVVFVIAVLLGAYAYSAAKFAGFVACLFLLGYWFVSMWMWRNDSRRDQPIVQSGGDAGKVLVRVRFTNTKDNGHIEVEEYDLPGQPESIKMLARAYLNGMRVTERGWTGLNKPFSSDDYRDLINIWEKRGVIACRNPDHHRSGWDATEKGIQIFKELADNDMDEFIDD